MSKKHKFGSPDMDFMAMMMGSGERQIKAEAFKTGIEVYAKDSGVRETVAIVPVIEHLLDGTNEGTVVTETRLGLANAVSLKHLGSELKAPSGVKGRHAAQ